VALVALATLLAIVTDEPRARLETARMDAIGWGKFVQLRALDRRGGKLA
jgi:hypothetical protein